MQAHCPVLVSVHLRAADSPLAEFPLDHGACGPGRGVHAHGHREHWQSDRKPFTHSSHGKLLQKGTPRHCQHDRDLVG